MTFFVTHKFRIFAYRDLEFDESASDQSNSITATLGEMECGGGRLIGDRLGLDCILIILLH